MRKVSSATGICQTPNFGTAGYEPMRFREVQAFLSNRIAWVAPLACLVMLLGLGVALLPVIQGADPGPALLQTLITAVVGGGVLFLFWRGRMVTQVGDTELQVQVYPLTRRHRFAFEELASCHARTYRPLREYGGWGVRCGFGGKAYNVSGNRGVQLVFRDGRRLLLGSQRADELAEAIHAAARGRGVELSRAD